MKTNRSPSKIKLGPILLSEIEAARERIQGIALRTPLIELTDPEGPARIYLKLENLQPIGSFKIRGAFNAMAVVDREALSLGVYTASAGNMAQGVAWGARHLGVPCSVVVPEGAPQTKLEAIERLGGGILQVPFEEWWQVIVDHRYEPLADLVFIHPVSNPAMIAGNGTVGLEILEDLPDLDTVVVPYGGGGLSCGIASAIHSQRPEVKVFAAEVSTGAPLAASLAAGKPVRIDYQRSFVDGIGTAGLLDEMWPLASRLLAGSLVVEVEAVARTIGLLVDRARMLAEGAGAVPVAAALSGQAGGGKVVCVVSGGNLDLSVLDVILRGEVPGAKDVERGT